TLSAGMRDLNGRFARRFNDRHSRVGHVFQGRYKAFLVEKESYLLTLLRYIVQNPVRAGFTQTAADWPWSSHRATMGLVAAPQWLAVVETLHLFDHEIQPARHHYAEFVTAGAGEVSPPFDILQSGFIGSESFVERVIAEFKQPLVL